MTDHEKILKAFANRRRLDIVRYLKQKKRANVSSIAKEIKLSLKATSKHLLIMSNADLVEKEQQGTLVFYRLTKSEAHNNLARAVLASL